MTDNLSWALAMLVPAIGGGVLAMLLGYREVRRLRAATNDRSWLTYLLAAEFLHRSGRNEDELHHDPQ